MTGLLPVETRARVAMAANLPVSDRLQIASERNVPLRPEVRRVWLETLPPHLKAGLVLGHDIFNQSETTKYDTHNLVDRDNSGNNSGNTRSVFQVGIPEDKLATNDMVAFRCDVIRAEEVPATLRAHRLECDVNGLVSRVGALREESRGLEEIYTTLVHYRARRALDAPPGVCYRNYHQSELQCRRCGFEDGSDGARHKRAALMVSNSSLDRRELFQRLPLEVRAALALGRKVSGEVCEGLGGRGQGVSYVGTRHLHTTGTTHLSEYSQPIEMLSTASGVGGRHREGYSTHTHTGETCSHCGQTVTPTLPVTTLPGTGKSEWGEFHLDTTFRGDGIIVTDIKPTRDVDIGNTEGNAPSHTPLPITTLPGRGGSLEWDKFKCERQKPVDLSDKDVLTKGKEVSWQLEATADKGDRPGNDTPQKDLQLTLLPGTGTHEEWGSFRLETQKSVDFSDRIHIGNTSRQEDIIIRPNGSEGQLGREHSLRSQATTLPRTGTHEEWDSFRLETQKSVDYSDGLNMGKESRHENIDIRPIGSKEPPGLGYPLRSQVTTLPGTGTHEEGGSFRLLETQRSVDFSDSINIRKLDNLNRSGHQNMDIRPTEYKGPLGMVQSLRSEATSLPGTGQFNWDTFTKEPMDNAVTTKHSFVETSDTKESWVLHPYPEKAQGSTISHTDRFFTPITQGNISTTMEVEQLPSRAPHHQSDSGQATLEVEQPPMSTLQKDSGAESRPGGDPRVEEDPGAYPSSTQVGAASGTPSPQSPSPVAKNTGQDSTRAIGVDDLDSRSLSPESSRRHSGSISFHSSDSEDLDLGSDISRTGSDRAGSVGHVSRDSLGSSGDDDW